VWLSHERSRAEASAPALNGSAGVSPQGAQPAHQRP
jgi:hypothetical protein